MRKFLKWLLPFLLLGFIYYPTFVWIMDRWSARDSYFGHGLLIPPVVLYWIWKKRDRLKNLPRQTEVWGLAGIFAGVLLQVASSLLRVYFLSAYSLIVILLGSIAFLFGRKVFREVWFPVAFLSVAVPLPLLAITEITLQLKFFVSEVTVWLLRAISIEATREGSYLVTPHSVILVGDPCSGLRSIIAFLCLGLVFAYEGQFSFIKKTVLFAAGFPLALLSNIMRVFFLALLGEIYGVEMTRGIVHDTSGVMVFVFAFGLFLLIRNKLEGAHARVG